jgi:hypothetical protein
MTPQAQEDSGSATAACLLSSSARKVGLGRIDRSAATSMGAAVHCSGHHQANESHAYCRKSGRKGSGETLRASVRRERTMSLGADVGPLSAVCTLRDRTPREIQPLAAEHGTESQGDQPD